ncbi:MAG TPA: MFS transporter [Bacteroidetes bacterium]|nr:MFS transporter [Bacteroidota bacterium]
MILTQKISNRNFYSLIWHAGFLAFARNFIDVDTVIPAMLVDAGGKAVQIGIMTAIMLGGSSITQLFFAPFISNYSFKKPFLLIGINSRIVSLLALSIILFYSTQMHGRYALWLIFIVITVFSLGGAFANISYTDILGKSINMKSRKPFFSVKQVITGAILFISALLAKRVLTITGYPVNYSYMFFIGFAALFIASLGFWNLKEVIPSKLTVKNPKHFLQLIRGELKQNGRLGYFLGFINTQGISITLLPFVILYAKENFQTQSADTGSFLLYKVIGSVATGLLLFALSGKYKYRYLLYSNVFLTFIIPIILLFSPGLPPFYMLFFVGGIVFAIYGITMNGVLLEVSGTENRALYTGIAGAGNMLPALFPLFGGWLIKHYGFQPFFILYILIVFSSLFFIHKLNCKK